MPRRPRLSSPPFPPEQLHGEIDLLRQEIGRIRDSLQTRVTRTSSTAEANAQALNEVQTTLRDIRLMLGLQQSQNAPVLSEPVPWSYFHVWIAHINERLEQLERRQSNDQV